MNSQLLSNSTPTRKRSYSQDTDDDSEKWARRLRCRLSLSSTGSTPKQKRGSEYVKNSSTCSKNTSRDAFYKAPENEIGENDELSNILHESEADEDSDLPVRYLDEFVFYDFSTNILVIVPINADPSSECDTYGVSGDVRTRYIEDEDSESDTEEEGKTLRVKLTPIEEIWTDGSEVWIRTEYAWYILERPSRHYQSYYTKMLLSYDSSKKPAKLSKGFKTTASSSGMKFPFVTPRVGKIAQGLFYRSLLIAGDKVEPNAELQNICVQDIPFVVHEHDPETVEWGEEIKGASGYYHSVLIDGVEYNVGDTVAVEAPKSDNPRETKLDHTWFCEIKWFFDNITTHGRTSKKEKYFHARWFSHGSKTILGETANPQGLFLLDMCDDNPVDVILQKISVRYLGPGEKEPVVVSEKEVGSSTFHLSHKWDPDDFKMTVMNLASEKDVINRSGSARHLQCYNCSKKYMEDFVQNCIKTPSSNSLNIHGISYHLKDFVYVKTRSDPLLRIGQITDLQLSSGNSKLKILFLERIKVDDKSMTPKSMKTLYFTDTNKEVDAESLDGKCFVMKDKDIQNLEEWLEETDSFCVTKEDYHRLKHCKICLEKHGDHLKIERDVKHKPLLRALDLFSGAGGLTTGIDRSGFIKTCWAVEMSPNAAQSLKENHPDIVVYNQDCSLVLKYAADLRDGKHTEPLMSLEKKPTALLPPPEVGEVDLIMGGPPCQPFSGMNRHKKVDDIRQTCIPTMLSYVEFYRPKYALIENVTGLLHFRLKGRQEGQRIVGGIEAGMVKFVMRAFTSLGYQCQLRILNSADYGSPQQRNRVIFWASLPELLLPEWPCPSHYPRGGHNSVIRNVPGVGAVPKASRNDLEPGAHDGHTHAPFYAVTIKEAIGDLPSWDWENPGILYPKGKKKEKITKPQFIAISEPGREIVGYDYPVPYPSKPKTLFQAFCRQEFSDFSMIEDHYTHSHSEDVVEKTANLPVVNPPSLPRVNFSKLPHALRTDSKGNELPEKRDTYNRLYENGQFQTMMTVVNPSSKGVVVIHPTDKRSLTVRETARAQGFSDSYQFVTEREGVRALIADQYRQIGNAVPVHLAYALGRGLGETLIHTVMNQNEDEITAVNTESEDQGGKEDMEEEEIAYRSGSVEI